jgi:hypothetical protein
MLEQMAKNGSPHVISWQPHGKAFRVHNPEVFARAIMPHYFNQTKYKSFQRQLYMYGFHRTNKGPDKGAYYHDLFIQKNKSMCVRMVRMKISKGTGSKKNQGEHQHEIMEGHPPQHYNYYNETNRDDTTTMAEPVPIRTADFSGVTANNNIYNSTSIGVGGGCLDSSWLGIPAEQKVQFFSGNFASVVAKEHIRDGDEVFFEGKRFRFVGLP